MNSDLLKEPEQTPMPSNGKGRTFKVLLIILLIAAVVYGLYFLMKDYYQPVVDESTGNADVEIVIGTDYFPTANIFVLAESQGFFEEEGVNARVDFYESYSEFQQAMADGDIDIVGMAFIDIFKKVAEGLPYKVVAAIDYSYGADGILSRDAIEVADLAGQKIAVEFEAISQFFLEYALQRFDMTTDDVEMLDYSAADAADAFVAGEVDYAVTYEPYLSFALMDAGGNVIFDSTMERGLIPDVWVVREPDLEENFDSYVKVFNAWFKAVDFLNENPEEAYAVIAEYIGVDPEEIPMQLEGFEVLDLRDNIAAFAYGSGFDSLYGSGNLAMQFLEDNGLIEIVPETEDVLEDSVIDAIQ